MWQWRRMGQTVSHVRGFREPEVPVQWSVSFQVLNSSGQLGGFISSPWATAATRVIRQPKSTLGVARQQTGKTSWLLVYGLFANQLALFFLLLYLVQGGQSEEEENSHIPACPTFRGKTFLNVLTYIFLCNQIDRVRKSYFLLFFELPHSKSSLFLTDSQRHKKSRLNNSRWLRWHFNPLLLSAGLANRSRQS